MRNLTLYGGLPVKLAGGMAPPPQVAPAPQQKTTKILPQDSAGPTTLPAPAKPPVQVQPPASVQPNVFQNAAKKYQQYAPTITEHVNSERGKAEGKLLGKVDELRNAPYLSKFFGLRRLKTDPMEGRIIKDVVSAPTSQATKEVLQANPNEITDVAKDLIPILQQAKVNPIQAVNDNASQINSLLDKLPDDPRVGINKAEEALKYEIKRKATNQFLHDLAINPAVIRGGISGAGAGAGLVGGTRLATNHIPRAAATLSKAAPMLSSLGKFLGAGAFLGSSIAELPDIKHNGFGGYLNEGRQLNNDTGNFNDVAVNTWQNLGTPIRTLSLLPEALFNIARNTPTAITQTAREQAASSPFLSQPPRLAPMGY